MESGYYRREVTLTFENEISAGICFYYLLIACFANSILFCEFQAFVTLQCIRVG